MIRSMTGYVKALVKSDEIQGSIECHAVNHRYLDCRIHLPAEIRHLELDLKKIASKKLQRGRLEVNIHLNYLNTEIGLKTKPEVLSKLGKIHQELNEQWGLDTQLSLQDLLSIEAIEQQTATQVDADQLNRLLTQQFEHSLEQLVQMRTTEGAQIAQCLRQHLMVCEAKMQNIVQHQAKVPKAQAELFKNNLKQLNLNVAVDEARIAQEIGLILNKLDITEEINRFTGHLKQVQKLLQNTPQESPAGTPSSAIGKKLDFLMQELHREINTICSKANVLEIVQQAVDLKVEVEKMREQIQNVE